MEYTVLSYAYQSGQDLQAVDFEIWISACSYFHCAKEVEHKVGTTNFGREIAKESVLGIAVPRKVISITKFPRKLVNKLQKSINDYGYFLNLLLRARLVVRARHSAFPG